MPKNANLYAAKRAKNDEFYTQLSDVEAEMRHYWPHFKGKVVLCNCDDPYESNFFKYFVLNFNKLGLRKLISTCYAGSPIASTQLDLLTEHHGAPSRTPCKAIVTEVCDTAGDGAVTMDDVAELFRRGRNELTQLQGDGDFRSPECLALLDEADIVVTNPPFSLFREYIGLLEEKGKGFVVIGPQNAITYKEIFPLIKDNRLWPGFGHVKQFTQPDGTVKKFGNVCWFTNLDIKKRHEELILVKRYHGHESDYPKYDNYDAINVDKVKDIPEDYDGVMGVPITFLDKYCPEQFEILGFAGNGYVEELGIKPIGREWVDAYRRQGGTGHMSPNMHSLVLLRGGWRRSSTRESSFDGERPNGRMHLSARRPWVPYARHAVEHKYRREGRVQALAVSDSTADCKRAGRA